MTGKTSIDEKINKNVILLPGTVKKENDNAKRYSAGLLTKLQSTITSEEVVQKPCSVRKSLVWHNALLKQVRRYMLKNQ